MRVVWFALLCCSIAAPAALSGAGGLALPLRAAGRMGGTLWWTVALPEALQGRPLEVRSRRGQVVPAQIDVLLADPDGRAKTVCVTLPAGRTIGRGVQLVERRSQTGRRAGPVEAPLWQTVKDQPRPTGLAFQGPCPLSLVAVTASIDGTERRADLRAESCRPARPGPFRFVWQLSGTLEAPESGSALRFRLEVETRAGPSPLEVRWEAEAAGPAEFADVALVGRLGGTRRIAVAGRGPGRMRRVWLRAAGLRAWWGADGESGPLASGDPGRLIAEVRGRRVAVGSPDLTSRQPRALFLDGEGTLVWSLRPGAFRAADVPALRGRLRFEHDGRGNEAGERFPVPIGLDRILAGARPLADGALGVSRDPLPRLFFTLAAAMERVRAARDRGDWRHPEGWANLEYDTAASFLLRAWATGDLRTMALARDALDHLVLCDLSRGEGATPPGLPHMHGGRHRSGRFELGHVFADGLVLGAAAFDDDRLREAALRMRDALAERVVSASFEREREAAWSLLALEALALLGRTQETERAAERAAYALLRGQRRDGGFALDPPREGERASSSETVWVTGGITIEALYRRWLATRNPALARAVAAAGGFLADVARDESGGFCRRILRSRSEGGEIRLLRIGTLGPVDRLMVAAGLLRAAQVAGEERFARLGRAILLEAAALLERRWVSPLDAARGLWAARAIADAQERLP